MWSNLFTRKTILVFLILCVVFIGFVVVFFLLLRPTSPEMSSDLSEDNLAFWMTNLSQKIRETPIIYLAIPGSHDSGTSEISSSSQIAPDADRLVKDLSFLGPLIGDVMAKWSLTQPYTIKQQLFSGIRYFDLRVATKNQSDKFYLVHNLYSEELDKDFKDINDFLETHSKEVVILDFQHFHAMQDDDHKRFKELLISTFGHKFQPYCDHMTSVTLDSMANNSYQVLVIYREAPPNLEATFWPSKSLPNPWADTYTVSTLIKFLSEELKSRDNSIGYVSQCVLTPDTKFILEHLYSDLKSKCFVTLEEDKYKWLNSKRPGPGGVNIIISDFIDYNNAEFAKVVIALNQKLSAAN